VKNILIIASAAATICLTATFGLAARSASNPVAAAPAASDAVIPATSKVMSVCQNCHGPRGDSVLANYPRLNAQQAEYIAAQLKSLRSHKRRDTHWLYMGGIVRELDDPMIAGLAKYYAGQNPTQPQTGGALATEGEAIFMNGVPAAGIAACQQCHGRHGEGSGVIPRIAGQHASYFRTVMADFRSKLRANDTMHGVVKNITDRQIEALASYLAND